VGNTSVISISPSNAGNPLNEDVTIIHKLLAITETHVEKILGGRNMTSRSTPMSLTSGNGGSATPNPTAAAAISALTALTHQSPRVQTIVQRLTGINDGLAQILQIEAISAKLFEITGIENDTSMTPNLTNRRSSLSGLGATVQNSLSLFPSNRKLSVPFVTTTSDPFNAFSETLFDFDITDLWSMGGMGVPGQY